MNEKTRLPKKTSTKLKLRLAETISLLRKEMLENQNIPSIVSDECLKLKMCRDYRLSFKTDARKIKDFRRNRKIKAKNIRQIN